MSDRSLALERAVEGVLTLGLAAAGVLLLVGLFKDAEAMLRYGILVLMATPVLRVALVTGGLLRRRDLVFGGLSAFVLAVLFLSAFMASRS
jgi:uncharacterized membrane protein